MRDTLRNHKAVLMSLLECEYGLLRELGRRFVLTDEEITAFKTIERYRGMYEENDKLLQVIIQQKDVEELEKFLLALKDTNQKHLANYIINNGSKLVVE